MMLPLFSDDGCYYFSCSFISARQQHELLLKVTKNDPFHGYRSRGNSSTAKQPCHQSQGEAANST